MTNTNIESTKLREILDSSFRKNSLDFDIRRTVKLTLSLKDLQRIMAKESDPYVYLTLSQAYVDLYKSFDEQD